MEQPVHPTAAPIEAVPGPEHTAAIAAARGRLKKVRRAAGVASFSGWTMAIFAGITLLTGFMSLPALLLGAGLAIVAWTELRGAQRIRQLDPTAGRTLALNQVVLMGMLFAYGGWGIWNAVNGPGAYDNEIAAGGAMAEMLEPIDQLTRTVTIAFYGAVIVGSLVAQGCAMVYYLTRRDHIEAFLRETPDWVTETLRAAA